MPIGIESQYDGAIVVVMLDEIVHDDLYPFCLDASCGCHTDLELLREYIGEPILDGLLTPSEAMDIWSGKQVGA